MENQDNTEQLIDELNPSEKETVEPQSWLFFWLGNTSLLAFNIIINALDIYIAKTGNQSIGNDLNRAYNFPCSIMALILCFILIKNEKRMFIISFIILILVLCVMPILLLVDVSDKLCYWFTIICVGITGVFSSTIMSGSFSIATQFGNDAATKISSGNGCCGVIAALLRVITKAVFSSKEQERISSSIYFFLAAAIILATLIYFIMKMRNPEVEGKFILKQSDASGIQWSNIVSTMKIIWPLWLGEALDYMITLTLFPGYVAAGPEGIFKSWNQVIITAVFNIFDWIGRSLPDKFIWPSSKYAPYPVIARLLFFPLEIISLQKIVNLGEPWFTVIMQIPFALTNGYFGTVCMIHGSNHQALNESQKATAGFLMTFAINAGIIVAMFLTYAMPTPKQ